MNNTCPTCGALYNVAEKDIGRKLKCKKCSAALKVTDDGLELDTPTGSAPPVAPKKAAVADANEPDEEEGGEEPVIKKKKKESKSYGAPGINPLVMVGGIPTILFAFGVFMVIVFIAFPLIGNAGTERANAYTQKLQNDRKRELFDLKPAKKKEADWSDAEKKKIEEETPKIEAKYARLIEEAALDAESTRIANIRDKWFESYGLMFGFILVSFGCIGYLRTEQSLVLKIVAGTILTLMMLVMFLKFSGGCSSPPPTR